MISVSPLTVLMLVVYQLPQLAFKHQQQGQIDNTKVQNTHL